MLAGGAANPSKKGLANGQPKGDPEVMSICCGAGVGRISSVDRAEEIVKSVWEAACSRMKDTYNAHVTPTYDMCFDDFASDNDSDIYCD